MKKAYITPKAETAKIKPEDPTTAFAADNHNSLAIVKADKNAANVINY